MRTVRLNRDEVVASVQENRDSHRSVFEEALEGYRDRWIKELERRLHDVRRGREINQYFSLPEPEDHTDDYDRILTMARMSVDDVIELSEDDFAMYVMDQWSWPREGTLGLRRRHSRMKHLRSDLDWDVKPSRPRCLLSFVVTGPQQASFVRSEAYAPSTADAHDGVGLIYDYSGAVRRDECMKASNVMISVTLDGSAEIDSDDLTLDT